MIDQSRIIVAMEKLARIPRPEHSEGRGCAPRASATHLSGRASRRAFTLAELLVVVSTLAVLAAIVVPRVTQRAATTAETITWNSLAEVRRAINDAYYDNAFEQLPYPIDPERQAHPQLTYLYVNPLLFDNGSHALGATQWTYNPSTQRGWNGPYLTPGGMYRVREGLGFTRSYGEEGDPAPLDGWGNPIVLQQPLMEGGAPSPGSRQFARLVSAGANGMLETSPTDATPLPTQTGDDLILPLTVAP